MPRSRTKLPDARITPRYAGLCTFGRYPRLADVEADARPIDWLVYGMAYDSGVTYRPGARFGPRAIREESQYLKRVHLEHGVDVCGLLSLADAGDAPVRPYHPKQMLDGACDFASGLPDAGKTKLLALGGDHSIAYANMKATWRRLGEPESGLALIHLDTHFDTIDKVSGEKYTHASPFRRLIEEGVLDPRSMLSIGIRGPLNTRDDLDFAKQRGIHVVTYDQWRNHDGEDEIRAFIRRLEGKPAYISFDVDCVDPVFAPGTGTPCPGGFTSAEVFQLLRSFAGINVAGADVVEVLPERDVAGNTALLAAHIAFEILALDALAQQGGS